MIKCLQDRERMPFRLKNRYEKEDCFHAINDDYKGTRRTDFASSKDSSAVKIMQLSRSCARG